MKVGANKNNLKNQKRQIIKRLKTAEDVWIEWDLIKKENPNFNTDIFECSFEKDKEKWMVSNGYVSKQFEMNIVLKFDEDDKNTNEKVSIMNECLWSMKEIE